MIWTQLCIILPIFKILVFHILLLFGRKAYIYGLQRQRNKQAHGYHKFKQK